MDSWIWVKNKEAMWLNPGHVKRIQCRDHYDYQGDRCLLVEAVSVDGDQYLLATFHDWNKAKEYMDKLVGKGDESDA